MPHLRTTIITHEHASLETGKDGMSIGQMVDMHLAEQVKQGKLINEVSLFFETEQEQIGIRDFYLGIKGLESKTKKAY